MEHSMQCVNVVRIIIYLIILFLNSVNSQNTVCESGYCYELQTESVDWLEAQRLCVKKGMSLSDTLHIDTEGYKLWTNESINAVGAVTCMEVEQSSTLSMSMVPCYKENSYICQTGYPRECLISQRGDEYMGTHSQSSGGQCISWKDVRRSQILNFTDGSAEKAKNYCRNPDNSNVGTWCYTSVDESSFSYCNIPSCVNGNSCFAESFTYKEQVVCSNNHCYIFVDGSIHGYKNWLHADKCCKSIGGSLLAANLAHVQQILKLNNKAWIIVSKNLGQYIKSDGSTTTCPYIISGSETMYEDCTANNRFICKRSVTATEFTTISETDKDYSNINPSAPSSTTVSQSPTTSTISTQQKQEDTQQTNINVIIYALVGAVVLLVAIIVFVIAIVCVRKKRATKKCQESVNEPTVFFHNDVYERGGAVNNQYTTHIPQSVYTAPKNNVYAEHQDNVYLKDNVYNNAKDNYAYSSAQKDDYTYSSPYKQDQLSHYATADTDYTKNSMVASQLSHHENSKNEMASHLDQDKVHTAGLDPVTNPMYSVNPISESTYSIPDKSLKRRKESNMPSGVQNTQPVAEPVYAEPPTLPIRNY